MRPMRPTPRRPRVTGAGTSTGVTGVRVGSSLLISGWRSVIIGSRPPCRSSWSPSPGRACDPEPAPRPATPPKPANAPPPSRDHELSRVPADGTIPLRALTPSPIGDGPNARPLAADAILKASPSSAPSQSMASPSIHRATPTASPIPIPRRLLAPRASRPLARAIPDESGDGGVAIGPRSALTPLTDALKLDEVSSAKATLNVIARRTLRFVFFVFMALSHMRGPRRGDPDCPAILARACPIASKKGASTGIPRLISPLHHRHWRSRAPGVKTSDKLVVREQRSHRRFPENTAGLSAPTPMIGPSSVGGIKTQRPGDRPRGPSWQTRRSMHPERRSRRP